MKIGSLFSGIGGLELGLERAGLGSVVWQVEMDPFCRRILAKHWPLASRSITDVRQASLATLERVDVLCGGFPCQDLSVAGRQAGLAGARSGLWFEYLRIVSEFLPRIVVVENVASGKKHWLPQCREGLESLGYRTRAIALSAAAVGAPHLRRRIFVVASNRDGERQEHGLPCGAASEEPNAEVSRAVGASPGVEAPPDAVREPVRFEQQRLSARRPDGVQDEGQGVAVHERVEGHPRTAHGGVARGASHWAAPPVFRGVDDGLPRRLDAARLKALGNAVCPQVAEVIGMVALDTLGERGNE